MHHPPAQSHVNLFIIIYLPTERRLMLLASHLLNFYRLRLVDLVSIWKKEACFDFEKVCFDFEKASKARKEFFFLIYVGLLEKPFLSRASPDSDPVGLGVNTLTSETV